MSRMEAEAACSAPTASSACGWTSSSRSGATTSPSSSPSARRSRHGTRGHRPHLAQQQGPAVHLRPVGAGLLDADPVRVRAARHGDGHLRLPRRAPIARQRDVERGRRTPSCRSSPRPCTTPASWRWSGCRPRRKPLLPRDRRRPAAQPPAHLGRPHDGVLRDRYRRHAATARPRHRASRRWCSASTPEADRRQAFVVHAASVSESSCTSTATWAPSPDGRQASMWPGARFPGRQPHRPARGGRVALTTPRIIANP